MRTDFGLRILVVIFSVSLLVVNPYLRGDGNGYYAYVRSAIIDRDLDFRNEYERANTKFKADRKNWERTPTGLVVNKYPPGSAILWAPFFLGAHLLSLGLNFINSDIPTDGFSVLYRWAVALGSACYGFIGFVLAYRMARSYFSSPASLIAVVAVWFAGSAVVYTHFLPFQAHANSFFITTLFVYVWHRTKGRRSPGQWAVLGALLGLATTVRYESCLFVLLPTIELGASVLAWYRDRVSHRRVPLQVFAGAGAFMLGACVGLMPQVVAKTILYGSPLATGYSRDLGQMAWFRPRFLTMLFSSAHGMYSWTPVLLLSTCGVFFFWKRDKTVATWLLAPFAGLAYLSAVWWGHEGSSYGNRFFVGYSLFFILGLAALIDRVHMKLPLKWICAGVAGLILWNLLLITQYGLGLVPRDAPIAGRVGWSQIVSNQFAAPVLLFKYGKVYFSKGPDGFRVMLEEMEEKQREAGLQL